MTIPYQIAVLAYVFNAQGKLLLLHRRKAPNKDLYSPIGGKLEQHLGESPYRCALREIQEEIGIPLALDDLRLMGIVSECAYASAAGAPSHWLMFCFEVTRPLQVAEREFDEGRLEWIEPAAIGSLSIPQTDRQVIWPLVQQHSLMLNSHDHAAANRGFFSVHIDCSRAGDFVVTHEHPRNHKQEARIKEPEEER